MDAVLKPGLKINRAQWTLIALIATMTVGGIFYHVLFQHDLGHSAALFLGIPEIIAILLALTPKAKSATR